MLFYSKERRKLVRVLTFLEGKCIGESEYTPELLYSFGETLAGMSTSLLDFRNIAIESRKSAWDLQHYGLNKKHLPLIKNPSDRKLVEYFFLQAKEFAEPFFEQLRKSTVHGDANEWNVLESDGRVSGIIDFGNVKWGSKEHDLTKLTTGEPNELSYLVREYRRHNTLSDQEVASILPEKIFMMLCGIKWVYTGMEKRPEWKQQILEKKLKILKKTKLYWDDYRKR